MKKEKIVDELGLARDPCITNCEPVTTKELQEAMDNPEWKKRMK
jgi:hypothetical protein